jgi:hypothetical protein
MAVYYFCFVGRKLIHIAQFGGRLASYLSRVYVVCYGLRNRYPQLRKPTRNCGTQLRNATADAFTPWSVSDAVLHLVRWKTLCCFVAVCAGKLLHIAQSGGRLIAYFFATHLCSLSRPSQSISSIAGTDAQLRNAIADAFTPWSVSDAVLHLVRWKTLCCFVAVYAGKLLHIAQFGGRLVAYLPRTYVVCHGLRNRYPQLRKPTRNCAIAERNCGRLFTVKRK